MSLFQSLWRWLRLPLLVLTLLIVGMVIWVAWVLTDQRYQHFLTQQLSDLLAAEVHVGTSHITVWRGLGLELGAVTVQEHEAASPFFTAEAIDIFLDVSSLLQGYFDFRHIVVTKPTLHVIEGVTQDAIAKRLRPESSQQQRTAPETTGWFTPRFGLQQLNVDNGTLTYSRASSTAPLLFTSIAAAVVNAENGAVTASVEMSGGQHGELGTVTLDARKSEENTQVPFPQQQWQGEVTLTDIRVQPIGQVLGKVWPQATVGFSGTYYGRWSGPVQLTGHLTLSDAQFDTHRISHGSMRLEQLVWPGPNDRQSVTMQAHLDEVQGLAYTTLPIVVQQGMVKVTNQTLSVTNLQGTIGAGSQLLDGTATITPLFGTSPATLALLLTVRTDLTKDAETVLNMPSAANNDNAILQGVQVHGYALAQLHISRDLGVEQPARYKGEVTLRDVAVQLPQQNIALTDIKGILQITPQALTTTSLTGKVGNAPFTVQGRIQNYQSSQREGEVKLSFSDIADQMVAALFPERIVIANNGTLSGKATIALSSGNKLHTSGVVQLRGVQLDPLTFLRPFTIAVGELNWQGQNGTFTVSKGQLVDSTFTAHGRISSMTPLHLTVSLDFPTLNVLPAIAIDPPRTTAPSSKPTTVIKANLTCGECRYKTVQANNLRLAVYWHDRQAEVDVTSAQVAGGTIKGAVTVWPDLGSLFFAPDITGVDVQSFFHAIDKPSDVLTGTVTGGGKVYVEDWRRWANPAHWDAVLSLTITDGVARQVPIIVRLWSALSLQGVLRLQVPTLPNEGLSFSTLIGDLAFGRGLAVTKQVSLNGDAVRIEASGQINLLVDTVDLFVQLMLLHGVTSALEWVPLVGDLLARGTDMLTTLSFRVTGPYADPTVTPAFVGAE